MIGYLEGRVLHADGQMATIVVAGVGYEVCVWPGFADQDHAAHSTSLWVWHVFSENAGCDILYGFDSVQARELAKLVAETDGVGPRKAHQFVTHAGLPCIVRAVQANDVDELRTVTKGIGPKVLMAIVATLRKSETVMANADPRAATVALAATKLGMDVLKINERINDILAGNKHATSEQIIHLLISQKTP